MASPRQALALPWFVQPPIGDARGLKQGRHFMTEIRILPAGLLHESLALFGRQFQRVVEDRFRFG
jgi:hypothetical protein